MNTGEDKVRKKHALGRLVDLFVRVVLCKVW